MIGARPPPALIAINRNTSKWGYRLKDRQVGRLTMTNGQATAHLYRPKLITTLQEGYGFGDFRSDLMAEVTVAIVALPLFMAIAVTSGMSPERGLYAAIAGCSVISMTFVVTLAEDLATGIVVGCAVAALPSMIS
jgi:MFS superfamily sulfate permease-like transporter